MNQTQLDKLAEPLLTQINGRVCLYLANDWMGNVGDRMIDAGTVQFLRRYNVEFLRHPISRPVKFDPMDKAELIFLFGSGSVGQCCRNVAQIRMMAAGWGLPCILLPSSAMDTGEDLSYCEAVFARDDLSRNMLQVTRRNYDVFAMPDMSCWYDPQAEGIVTKRKSGLFLRSDNATAFECEIEKRDPTREQSEPRDYCLIAGRYENVVTDRLHFALAALLMGRSCTMLPTSWHKMRSYWQTWHEAYGDRMKWAWDIPE